MVNYTLHLEEKKTVLAAFGEQPAIVLQLTTLVDSVAVSFLSYHGHPQQTHVDFFPDFLSPRREPAGGIG